MTLTDTVRAGTNINTWITLFGFCLTIGGGLMVYGAERAENRSKHLQAEQRIAQMDALIQRHAADRLAALAAQETRLRTLEHTSARDGARLDAILQSLARIEARLERSGQ